MLGFGVFPRGECTPREEDVIVNENVKDMLRCMSECLHPQQGYDDEERAWF